MLRTGLSWASHRRRRQSLSFASFVTFCKAFFFLSCLTIRLLPAVEFRWLPQRTRLVLCLLVMLSAQVLLSAQTARGDGPVSFRNDVMAVLSKAGCNAGTCHGNANGKGGFKLSLRGEDPDRDFQRLTHELSGRRLNIADPDRSLLLRKATMDVAHGGGRRFGADADEYRILREWIAAGAVADPAAAPTLESLAVTPREAVVELSAAAVPLQVTATFSDGAKRDVTSLAVYEASSPVLSISHDGIVSSEREGEATIVARFLNRQVPVRVAFVPSLAETPWDPPPVRNEIDRIVFDRLRALRLHPSEVCDDVVFLRRASLDLLGALPSGDVARQFVESSDPEKRTKLVDDLLQRPEYADYWAIKWSDLLRNEERTLDRKGVENFHAWIVHHVAQNTPLDEFARQLVSGRGSTYASPASNYYRALRDPATRAESTAQVFLGIRLQCAKCHNHPFDRWTQDDYYSWTSVFSRIDYKVLENRRRDDNDKHEFIGEQIVFFGQGDEVDDPRTGKPQPPRLLNSGNAIPRGDERLDELAGWLTSPDNPFFARTQVNRVWQSLLGRGIVDPVDDFRLTNPPVHPELLDWLTAEFIAHGYDQQWLIRTIMNSSVYQLSSEPNETNAGDESHFSRGIVRRLTAEQLLDSLVQVTGGSVQFSGYPAGTRAAEIPGVRAVGRRDGRPSSADQFLVKFGKPPRLQSCDCERSDEATLAQTFDLVSGPLIDELLVQPDNSLGRLLDRNANDEELVAALYWGALGRPATDGEQAAAKGHLQSGGRRAAAEDVLWSLINSSEFLLRR